MCSVNRIGQFCYWSRNINQILWRLCQHLVKRLIRFFLFTGVPLSEIKSKQSMQIKVLKEEEIEKMRVACRVRL